MRWSKSEESRTAGGEPAQREPKEVECKTQSKTWREKFWQRLHTLLEEFLHVCAAMWNVR